VNVRPPASGPQSTASWFTQYLQPHEAMLRAWLHSRFPSRVDVEDIVQDAYLRVLEAYAGGPIAAPKAFLFATARNLALNRLRHQRVARTDALAEIDELGVLESDTDVSESVARNQELELLTQAIQSLPVRCRQVITLRKIYGLAQKEVAAELGIAEHTVEAQATIGLRKLAEFFRRFERRGHDAR
jgi:RNA polymerase sigma factor (sigma-70 family)